MLSDVLAHLGDDEPICSLSEVGEGLHTARLRRGRWYDVARWLSEQVGGMVFPKVDGLTWVCGKRVEVLLSAEAMEDLLAARLICTTLGVEPALSLGGCARRLLKHVGPPQYPEKGIYARYHPYLMGYHDCQPGQYPQADYYDVSGCYYSLLCRLPCLRVTYSRQRLVWHAWAPGEEDRWRAVLGLVGGHKRLRNCMWGCTIGGTGRVRAFHAGKVISLPGKLGPFRPAGLVVGRSAWELCCQSSHASRSVLSNTDSVVALGGEWPVPWESVGLSVRSLASGEADICYWGSYRVGPRMSELYRQGSRTAVAAPRQEITGGILYSQWLARAA